MPGRRRFSSKVSHYLAPVHSTQVAPEAPKARAAHLAEPRVSTAVRASGGQPSLVRRGAAQSVPCSVFRGPRNFHRPASGTHTTALADGKHSTAARECKCLFFPCPCPNPTFEAPPHPPPPPPPLPLPSHFLPFTFSNTRTCLGSKDLVTLRCSWRVCGASLRYGQGSGCMVAATAVNRPTNQPTNQHLGCMLPRTSENATPSDHFRSTSFCYSFRFSISHQCILLEAQ